MEENLLPAGADAVAVAAVHRHRDSGKSVQTETGENPGSGGDPDEGGGGGGQNEFQSLGFVEIEWGRLSSGRPVFCPGQRPPAARQRPPVEADRAARGRAIFPSSAPITQTGSNDQIQNVQEPQDILETSCAPLSLSLH